MICLIVLKKRNDILLPHLIQHLHLLIRHPNLNLAIVYFLHLLEGGHAHFAFILIFMLLLRLGGCSFRLLTFIVSPLLEAEACFLLDSVISRLNAVLADEEDLVTELFIENTRFFETESFEGFHGR